MVAMTLSTINNGEEKTLECFPDDNNDKNDNDDSRNGVRAALSWTASEQDFGQKNFFRYEPDNDLLKLNANDDWDAIVLYMRKEDLVQSPNSGGGTKTSVHARTFVHGQDENGKVKWRKVPLQIANNQGSILEFAKTIHSPLFSPSSPVGGEETKHDDNGRHIPHYFSFGEGLNDPVQPLLGNDLQLANENMKKLTTKKIKAIQINDSAQKASSDTVDIIDVQQTRQEADMDSDASESTGLKLNKAQTIKALTYLRKVTEMRKKKLNGGLGSGNKKIKSQTIKDSSNECFPIKEEKEEDEEEQDEVLAGTGSMNESIEVAKKKRSFEEDQTALLDHACGLRHFCNKPTTQIEVDHDEILFESRHETANVPVVSIELKGSHYDASVLTTPTMLSPKKELNHEQKEKIRNAMLKLLRTKRKLQASSAVGEHKEVHVGEEQKAARNTPALLKILDEENPPRKGTSSNVGESQLAEMGNTLVSELEKLMDTPRLGTIEEATAKESISGDSASKPDEQVKKNKSKEDGPIVAPDQVASKDNKKETEIPPAYDYDYNDNGNTGVANDETAKVLDQPVSNDDVKSTGLDKSPEQIPNNQVHSEENYSDVAAIEVNYTTKKKGRRSRFKKSKWSTAKKSASIETVPTTDLADVIKIETIPVGNAEHDGSTLVTVVRNCATNEEVESLTNSAAQESEPISYSESETFATETTISEIKPMVVSFPNKNLETGLSFDENKVRERVAREHDMQETEGSFDSAGKGETRKQRIRKGLGAIFSMKNILNKEDASPVKDSVIVEVSTETVDQAQFEEIEVAPTKQTPKAKEQDDGKNEIKKILSLSKGKKARTQELVLDEEEPTKPVKPTGHGLRVPAFLSKRPPGILTGTKPHDLVKTTTGGSKESSCSSGIVIDSAESNAAVEASLAGTIPTFQDVDHHPPTMCCGVGITTPSTQGHIRTWPKRFAPGETSPFSQASSMPNSPKSDFSDGILTPTTVLSDTIILAGSSSAMSVEVDTTTDIDIATHGDEFGGKCTFFTSNDSCAGYNYDKNEDDEMITVGTSEQGGDNEIIEVAKSRIRADHAQEKAFQAAEAAARAAKIAEAMSQKAKERSSDYNHRHRHRPIGSFFGSIRQLGSTRPRSPPPRSPRDPPARSAAVTIAESGSLDALETSIASPPPPPPPQTSPRRRASSPRRKGAPSTKKQADSSTPENPSEADGYDLPPPPPPPPSPPRRRSRRSQYIEQQNLLLARKYGAAHDQASSMDNSTAGDEESVDSRFSWIKSMIPGSQRLFPPSHHHHHQNPNHNPNHRHQPYQEQHQQHSSRGGSRKYRYQVRQQSRHHHYGRGGAQDFDEYSYGTSIYTKDTGASTDGGREVMVVSDTFVI